MYYSDRQFCSFPFNNKYLMNDKKNNEERYIEENDVHYKVRKCHVYITIFIEKERKSVCWNITLYCSFLFSFPFLFTKKKNENKE